MKTCSGCHAQKDDSAFGNNRRKPDGLQGYCRPCGSAYRVAWAKRNPEKQKASERAWRKNNREHVAAAGKAWREKNPRRVKENNRRAGLGRYGITPDQYDALLLGQGGVCAICATTNPGGYGKRFHVDHDRSCCSDVKSCGACVRGLLCMPCNVSLGNFRDSPDILRSALAYLLKRIKSTLAA